MGVFSFKGEETINTPFQFEIEFITRNHDLDIEDFIGSEGLLTISDRSGGVRHVHGLLRQIGYVNTRKTYSHFRCLLVPRLWFLSETQDHKIYQHKTVYEIIEDILKKHTFLPESYSFKLKEMDKYSSREYCVQYGESDLHFLTRLCEEEGIFFYFEHTAEGHCLCFSDAPGGPAIQGESGLLFHSGFGTVPDTAVISDLRVNHKVNSDISTYKEWNFTKPSLSLLAEEAETEWERAPVPHAMRLETYQHPHLYQRQDEGDRYVDIQLQRQLTYREWAEGESDVSRVLPGHVFSLNGHPRSDANRSWWLVSVRHAGEQPGVLEHEAPNDTGFSYSVLFTVIPDTTRFVPVLKHPKVRVDGVQSAIVTGPTGEEVYTDEYGRVKVQFHWDRDGQRDEKTTCWVRVADTHAGNNFGGITVPRIGEEVLVEFMEGDPDRPLITGRGYNRHKMPPWELPEQKTLTGFQTREFNGDQRNQVLFDDTQGEVQAQISSDHALSQLNLGHITRVNHIQGRKEKRGEGFELRTDDWGVVRAGAGMLISTHKRNRAESYQTDLKEAAEGLSRSVDQHKRQADLALHHAAQVEEPDEYLPPMQTQLDEVMGGGEQEELSAPHMVITSPAGLELITPETSHMTAGKQMAFTAMKNITAAAAKSIGLMGMRSVSLYAHQEGMKLYAGHGKVDIQAHDDDLDLIAEKLLRIISAKQKIHISAPKEILLTAGDSYVKITGSGVEIGSSGDYKVFTASHKFDGPNTIPPIGIQLPSSTPCMAEAARTGFPFVEV